MGGDSRSRPPTFNEEEEEMQAMNVCYVEALFSGLNRTSWKLDSSEVLSMLQKFKNIFFLS